MADSGPVTLVHLLVLVHGMWGNPGHLAEMARIIRETKEEAGPDGTKLHVLLAETNREDSTYDGIDWGAERVAEEVTQEVEKLANEGKRVTRFSVTGYSLGGLVSRYLVGILYQRKFFEDVQPVNFNTVATPHIGLLRYSSILSSLTSALGSRLLSQTGEQFYCVDKWSSTGRPLLEVLADPNRIFYQALGKFGNIRIYANAVNDVTVPYTTAAIELQDPFADMSTSGLEIPTGKLLPINQVNDPTPSPPPPPSGPRILSAAWFKSFRNDRPLLPPFLQFRFPFNILLYASLPLLIPVAIIMAITRLALATHSSRQRIKLLEKDAPAHGRLSHVLAQLEKQVEDAVADFIDSSDPDESESSSSSPSLHIKGTPGKPSSAQPILSPVQKRIVASLNKLPIKKELAYIDGVRNSHATIVCRDVKRFDFHRRGEGVLKHWADSFML
ncbi:hypothetical protein EYR38_008720 [Pleurotus pulmonarius]|nr:hypothetical protein EYR38_008720 [Pleurotus pulmonarius]